MVPFRSVLAASCVVLFAPAPAAAQEAPPVPLDSRVRVTTAADAAIPETGRLRAWSDSAFLLERADRSRASIPLSDVARLELSEGTLGHALLGGLIGVGAALAVTGVLALTMEENENTSWAAVGGILAVPGGLLGLLVGSRIRTETWREIPLDADRPDDPARVSGRP